jgi:hypothetical protein
MVGEYPLISTRWPFRVRISRISMNCIGAY